jgi:hypothetical protein
VFLRNNHDPDFFDQECICYNDTLIGDNLDIIKEMNIQDATYSDEMKGKHHMTYICSVSVIEKSQDICRVYLDMNGFEIDLSIRAYLPLIVQIYIVLVSIFFLDKRTDPFYDLISDYNPEISKLTTIRSVTQPDNAFLSAAASVSSPDISPCTPTNQICKAPPDVSSPVTCP